MAGFLHTIKKNHLMLGGDRMIELRHRLQFFLGANSADGFSSLYDRWIDQEAVQAFYVIKGGAGCGKSTLMGRVAETMEIGRAHV